MTDCTSEPLVTILLICFNQEKTIDAAVDSVLNQDYPYLEIIISDDASQDNTYDRIRTKLDHYQGPHTIKVLRNPQNLGIGGNLDQAVKQSHGELIFIAAGDDVSLPHRVSAVVKFWVENNCKPNLIAAYLNDVDDLDRFHGVIRIGDLSQYRSLEDWSRRGPPHVIGAAQAWTRRLFDRFGGIPSGVIGEDMVMAFRAIASGSAVTLPIPLVNYRRGGITSQRKALNAQDVIKGLTRKLRSSQIELSCLLQEAKDIGVSRNTLAFIAQKLDKELFIERMFAAHNVFSKLKIGYLHKDQTVDFRIRIFIYSTAPWLLAPFFFLKLIRYRKL